MNKSEKLQKTILMACHKLQHFDVKNMQTDEENEQYNRLLIEKAVMIKKLSAKKESKLKNFFNKVRRKANGETLICDNF